MRFNPIRNNAEDDNEINMTPMLDIVFIMLIFFIVTTTFVRETGIEVNRPAAKTAEAQGTEVILVAISPAGEIWIDRHKVTLAELGVKVRQLHLENPNFPVVLQADKLSQTGLLVQVMDQVRLAGISKISLASDKD